MSSVRINSNIKVELKDILSGISQLSAAELETFLSQVSTILAKKKTPNLSKEETSLLQKINKGLSEEFQERYAELISKSVEGTLTKSENKEWSKMIVKAEKRSVERLEYLIKLASLWNTSIDEVMDRLGIKSPPDIHA